MIPFGIENKAGLIAIGASCGPVDAEIFLAPQNWFLTGGLYRDTLTLVDRPAVKARVVISSGTRPAKAGFCCVKTSNTASPILRPKVSQVQAHSYKLRFFETTPNI
jgi:hypothetical protein